MTVKTLAPQVKHPKSTFAVGSVLPDLDAPLSHPSGGEASRGVETLAPQLKFSKCTFVTASVSSDLGGSLFHSSNGDIYRMRDPRLMGEVERNSLKYPTSFVLPLEKWEDHGAVLPQPMRKFDLALRGGSTLPRPAPVGERYHGARQSNSV